MFARRLFDLERMQQEKTERYYRVCRGQMRPSARCQRGEQESKTNEQPGSARNGEEIREKDPASRGQREPEKRLTRQHGNFRRTPAAG